VWTFTVIIEKPLNSVNCHHVLLLALLGPFLLLPKRLLNHLQRILSLNFRFVSRFCLLLHQFRCTPLRISYFRREISYRAVLPLNFNLDNCVSSPLDLSKLLLHNGSCVC